MFKVEAHGKDFQAYKLDGVGAREIHPLMTIDGAFSVFFFTTFLDDLRIA